MEEVVPISKFRTLGGRWRIVSIVMPAIALVLGIIQVFHISFFGMVIMTFQWLYLLLAFFIPLSIIWIPLNSRAPRNTLPWYDILICLLSFGIPLLFAFKTAEIVVSWSVTAPTYALVLSAILWAIGIEAARRAVGWIFASVLFFFSIYPLFGGIMPGVLQSVNFEPTRVIGFHILSEDSLMGIPMHSFGRLVFGYLVFAIALQTAGIGKFFTQIAITLLGKTRGGNAKVAIVASGLFASISGHAGANILTTGTFTIPAMKKEGFTAEFAGAVEAVASSGGTLMPPIMGSVAFIMAEFIRVPYVTIAIAAAVPAILYYVCLFSQIDAHAARMEFRPTTYEVSIPPIRRILFDNLHLIISFVALLFLLFYMRLETWAPWLSAGVVLVASTPRKQTRLGPQQFVSFLQNLGRLLGQMVAIMGPAGMLIGAFMLTGLAYSLPYTIVRLAAGNLYLLLMFGAAASFILGMGLHITACYIFLAILVAPGLVAMGIDIVAAHLFVLYCGMWAGITPPVALYAFTAAIVAGGNAMKTGFEAMRLGVAKYLLPFFFVLSPAMILRGPPLEMLQVFPTALLGLILIGGAVERYIWRIGKIGILPSIPIFAAGFLLGLPGTKTDLMGIAIVVVVFGSILLIKRRSGVSMPSQFGGGAM